MQLKVKLVKFNTDALRKKKAAIIKRVAQRGVKIFRSEITKRHLINSGNLKESVGAVIGKNGVTIEVGADYAEILDRGVRKHKMTYLVDAGPIPIITKSGKKIFRVANNESIRLKGGWKHPGFKRGKGFLDASVNKVESACKEIIIDEGLI
jgi:hypothetical protein